MDLIKFIPEQLLILVAAIYVLGVFLKKTERVKDNLIPIILMVFAIAFSMLLTGVSAVSCLQGILCWGVSIGINQLGKQIEKGSL
ncbi:MAG: phage holin family protein [Clostridium sp.]